MATPRSLRHHAANPRVTIPDVAARAGVGWMTVSRTLRQPGSVAEATRRKVLKAVKELGYVPNHFARGLLSGAAPVVPVIIPTLDHPVYVSFLDGANQVLARHGYQILLGATGYDRGVEEQLITALLGWRPEGLLLAGVDHSPATRKRLKQARLPLVEFMDLAEKPLGMNVGFSHFDVGKAVANHLIQKGYRHIAYAGTLTETDAKSVKRIAGFQQTLRENKLPCKYVASSTEPFSIHLGGRLLEKLLERNPKIDAVFFGNDDMAAGALFSCLRRGIRVPERVAIIGFNDQEIAGATVPAISSVATPRRKMGELAATMLVAQMKGEPVAQRRVDLGFQIIDRETT
jgi:LacI family gluconate utilization system Gnt-I transcriptional repressor